jgi:LemA protein
MSESGWFWMFFALTVFWALGAYNRLVRLRAHVATQYTHLMTSLTGLTDLAQQAISDAVADNHVHQPSDALHIAACWRRLSTSSTQARVAMVRMQEHSLMPQSIDDLNQAWRLFEDTWDELKVSPWSLLPEPLRAQWQEQRLLSQPLRRAFNQAVEQYNQAIAMWPANLVARLFQFRPAGHLQEGS